MISQSIGTADEHTVSSCHHRIFSRSNGMTSFYSLPWRSRLSEGVCDVADLGARKGALGLGSGVRMRVTAPS